METPSLPYVLIVEDDPDVATMLADLGKMGEFIAVCVSRSLAAREIVGALHPVVVLIDIMLPDASGMELARELRLRADVMMCPLIAMSASTEMARLARESGLFNAVIDKPFDVDQLCALIAAQITTHQVLSDRDGGHP